MDRRSFIKGSAAILAATAMPEVARGREQNQENGTGKGDGKLIVSAPMLQNYAETSMGVAFAVSDMANGYVRYSTRPDMSDAVTVKCGGYRVTAMNDKVMQVRLTGLKPATTYWYTIGADRIAYKGGYDMKITGTEDDPRIYSFRTAGKQATPHFCVINDTHVHWETIGPLMDRIAKIHPSCVIWNGDASNVEETIDNQINIFLDPSIGRKDYAAEIPYLFCPGNHDSRGMANRHLENVWMFRQQEERSSRDWDLGRNFAVRMGDVAMIGLDTAEDKLDTNPIFAGLFNSGEYREAQTLWLKDVLKRKDIASAPYLVAFCHIPLFDPDPSSNPGDIAPADYAPEYTTDFAAWQRTCARLWTPLLEKAHCQLIVTAHQHKYRYDAPEKGRSWAQIVGGGPHLQGSDYATIIEGSVSGGKLTITVHDAATGNIKDVHSFSPR